MDRYLLRYFLAIVETGNFSRAAARENVAQPTLSAGIAKLEGQLQARLLDRTNRRVHLTEAGSRFLVCSSNAVGMVDSTATRSCSGRAAPETAAWARLNSCSMRRAWTRKRLPASVRWTRRLVRSNSRAWSWPSSLAIPAERVGWATFSRAAARLKFPVSTIARK